MESLYAEFKQRIGEIHDLTKTGWLLNWDQSTMMPPGGGPVRAEQAATIARLTHRLFTSDDIGTLLDKLAPYEQSLPADSHEASLIRVTRGDWEKARRVPNDLAGEISKASAAGYQAWVQARKANDFAAFLPYVERMLDLKRRYIACFPEFAEPYDALIDDYERGLSAAEIRAVFARVREGLVPLVKRVTERADMVDQAPMHGDFPADKQRELAERVIARLGYNAREWRLDPTAHPFASALAINDVRLTTRYDERYLAMSFFGTMHEMGHGLYEHGVSPALSRTPLARGASHALHESQSRMIENLVGRGRPFWDFAYPIAREVFPDHFANYDAEAVYRAVNKMAPSLIRVEADELTYSLHIILRFDIEQELFNGSLEAKELPEIWNAKMKELLGVDVPSDADGVMQDVHWSGGSFGYFPTYALGTIIASQIWTRIARDLPDLDQNIAEGEFGSLLGWLGEHLHRHGRKFTPRETTALVAGGPIDPEPYLSYLNAKVTALYGAA